MEQTLRKPTDAEFIAGYRKAELKYGSTDITDDEIIAQRRISESKYARYMFYKPEEKLFVACYPLKDELKMLGYYIFFEEAEDRVDELLNKIINKLEKEVTENEHLLNV
jgi:transcription initiation factor IIE alpha subunit